jgi:membrane-associated protein
VPSFLDPQHLISTFGLIGILCFVFAESGVLIGFFLPGDSLLFTAGLLIADGTYLHTPLWLMCLLVSVAAALGDQFGYLFGRRFGPSLFRRPDSRLFKQENLTRARGFFERYGARSIVLARFIPIVRTFTPIVAGASRMHYRTFLMFNLIGGTLWGSGVTVLGYFLGQVAFVRSNIELILIGIVVVSVLPVLIQLFRHRGGHSAGPAAGRPREGEGTADQAQQHAE